MPQDRLKPLVDLLVDFPYKGYRSLSLSLTWGSQMARHREMKLEVEIHGSPRLPNSIKGDLSKAPGSVSCGHPPSPRRWRRPHRSLEAPGTNSGPGLGHVQNLKRAKGTHGSMVNQQTQPAIPAPLLATHVGLHTATTPGHATEGQEIKQGMPKAA